MSQTSISTGTSYVLNDANTIVIRMGDGDGNAVQRDDDDHRSTMIIITYSDADDMHQYLHFPGLTDTRIPKRARLARQQAEALDRAPLTVRPRAGR